MSDICNTHTQVKREKNLLTEVHQEPCGIHPLKEERRRQVYAQASFYDEQLEGYAAA